MAIDVEHGAQQGATAPGRRVMKLGATKDEIVEVLRVAYYVGESRALFTGPQSSRTCSNSTDCFLSRLVNFLAHLRQVEIGKANLVGRWLISE